ncbi:CRTAC1 family protein [Aureibaculum marinum]|uniref:CRTAC1 family protein n=1 Tax=Aureibaculum marinum TaxID=2487930 RepID=A0A3N4NRS4_9FLAO|nr:CRTAC1 family protein [Aureibaculum marinum]RPD99092.1 CRTAC1 family protein [Aureibaculum marinum]
MKIRPYIYCLLVIISCTSSKKERPSIADTSIKFSEVTEKVGLKTENNWKYGGPTIADINNDGKYDLLLGNHDTSPIQLFWAQEDDTFVEQKGLFPKADLHGMAAGDYDKDGDLDILISLGGGNGTTPQPQRLLRNDNGNFVDATEEAGLSEMGARGRSVRWIDLDNDGDLDFLQINAQQMVNEDIPRNILFENNGDGTFTYRKSEVFENIDAERLLITDFNNDGILDLLTFSPYSPFQFWKGNNDFTFTNLSQEWLPENLQSMAQVSTVAEADLDNDGDMDYYLARGKSYYQIANNSISFNEDEKRLDLRDEGNKSHDGITFYADADIELSDFYRFPRGPEKPRIPLFIGNSKTEYKMPYEVQKVTQTEAKGFPENLDKSGWYLGYLGEGKWRLEWLLKLDLAWDVRASIIGVTKVEPDWEPQNLGVPDILLVNEGTHFKDASSSLPKESLENNWGITTADFDNDGLSDFFLYRFGGLIQRTEDVLLKNKGNLHFEAITDHGANHIPAKAHGDMGAAFDYNLDGKVDVLSGDDDNGQWLLYQNKTDSKNNYVFFWVGNSKSGVDAYGAKVKITTASGSQFKLIGSGSASHAQSFLNMVHFGLGRDNKIETAEIIWRNGERESLSNIDVNTAYQIPNELNKGN